MEKVAVVFSGRNGLDVVDFRSGVLRIPEVTLRLREAQAIIDRLDLPKVDLLGLLASDDEFFFRDIQLKSLVAAIVQVGLYDRYLQTQPRPHVMVGNSNGDSAMLVCSGRQTFKEMVETSPAFMGRVPVADTVVPLVSPAVPVLAGLTLTEYHAFELTVTDNGLVYGSVPGGSMELRKLVGNLFTECGLARFVNIGPACALRDNEYRAIGDGEIESIDSIELDPLLGWFWRGSRFQAMQLAQ